MYVIIDQGACVGCGSCEAISNELFRMNSFGWAEVLADCTDENKAEFDEAIKFCPAKCIHYEAE